MLVNATNVLLAQRLLTEYGSAMRGSWGDIDGRTVKMDMIELAEMLTDDTNADATYLRRSLGICEAGLGHWTEFCEEECRNAAPPTSGILR